MLDFRVISSYYDPLRKQKFSKLFGVTILRRELGINQEDWFLCDPSFWFMSFKKLCFSLTANKLIKENPDVKQFYVMNSNIGETFLLFFHLNEVIKNLKLDNCLFVLNSKSRLELFQMFFPDLPATSLPLPPLFNDYVTKHQFNYKGVSFYCPFHTKYFLKTEELNRLNEKHFYYILKKINSLSVPSKAPALLDTAINSQIDIHEILGDKFVILSPESTSSSPLPRQFWEKLALSLKDNGYQVYCNVSHIGSMIDSTVCFNLSLKDMMIMASRAQAVIGLRSGFFDLVLPYARSLHAIYSSFPRRGAYPMMKSWEVLTGFSLQQIDVPHDCQIVEYEVSKYPSKEDLLQSILDNLE